MEDTQVEKGPRPPALSRRESQRDDKVEVSSSTEEFTRDEERRLLRKFDFLLLPPLAFMYVWYLLFSFCASGPKHGRHTGIFAMLSTKATSGTLRRMAGTRYLSSDTSYTCFVDSIIGHRTSVLSETRFVPSAFSSYVKMAEQSF